MTNTLYMKILWFTNTPSIASSRFKKTVTIGGWLYALGTELKKDKRIELAIAFYHDELINPFVEDGVAFYPIYNKMDSKKNRSRRIRQVLDEDPNDVYEFNNIVEDYKPDLIHVHGTELAFIRIVENAKIPVVVSIQGNITVYSHFYYRGISKAEIPKYILRKRGIKKSSFHRNFDLFLKKAKREQTFSRKFKYIVGRTRWDRNIFNILSPNARYYHNDEILRSEFYSAEWRMKIKDNLTIYSTTTNVLYKGFETVAETISLLNQRLQIDFEWRIGGLSEKDSIVKLVKRKLGQTYPDKNIIFLGRLDASSIVNEMLGSDIYIMPSHIENSPNNLCEAMILGLPCIATHAGGTNSLLRDGEEGLIIQDGDPWSMAGAIIDMYQNKAIAEEYGKMARKRALIRHNPEKITNELINIYNSIISNHKKI